MKLLPDQFKALFRAKVAFHSGEYKSSDGSPVMIDPMSLPSLADENVREQNFEKVGYVTYVGEAEKLDGEYSLRMEWVHLDGTGATRITLPDKAVRALLNAFNRVDAQSRSERSKRASETAKRNGFVPFANVNK